MIHLRRFKHSLVALMAFLIFGARHEVRAADDSPFRPDERTLLLDHLDAEFTADGKTFTKPQVMTPGESPPGARVPKGFEVIDGVFGKALRMHGPNLLVYPGGENLDLAGGQADLWVALNYDPAERNEKTKTILRNEFFLTFHGPRRSRVTVYSVLTKVCVGVVDKDGQLIA